MNCQQVDALGGAYALQAVSADERRMIDDHLATCAEPHAELRELVGLDAVVAASAEPMQPSTALRSRLMATVERTPQEHRPASTSERSTTRPWMRWVAGLTAAALVAMAVLTGNLWLQLRDRDDQLAAVARVVAQGGTIVPISGEAGSGYLVDPPSEGASLILADVTPIPADRLYEVWLIDADGTAVAAGTFTTGNGPVSVAAVEQDLDGYQALALTVEKERVQVATTQPVLVAPIPPGGNL